jgi:hypothetical protein
VINIYFMSHKLALELIIQKLKSAVNQYLDGTLPMEYSLLERIICTTLVSFKCFRYLVSLHCILLK